MTSQRKSNMSNMRDLLDKLNAIQEDLIDAGSPLEDILEMNLFMDMLDVNPEDCPSDDEEMANVNSDREFKGLNYLVTRGLCAKYKPIAEKLAQEIEANSDRELTEDEVDMLNEVWYEASDLYQNGDVSELARIYDSQIQLVKQLLGGAVAEEQVNEDLIDAGSPLEDILEMNLFADMLDVDHEDLPSDADEMINVNSDREFKGLNYLVTRDLVEKYKPIAEKLAQEIEANSDIEITEDDADMINEVWYEASDIYQDGQIDELARIYNSQIQLVKQLLSGANESAELEEGDTKDRMTADAESMELEDFLLTWGNDKYNKQFWQAVNSEPYDNESVEPRLGESWLQNYQAILRTTNT